MYLYDERFHSFSVLTWLHSFDVEDNTSLHHFPTIAKLSLLINIKDTPISLQRLEHSPSIHQCSVGFVVHWHFPTDTCTPLSLQAFPYWHFPTDTCTPLSLQAFPYWHFPTDTCTPLSLLASPYWHFPTDTCTTLNHYWHMYITL